MDPQKTEYILSVGPEKGSLSFEQKEDGETVGGTYCYSFEDLIMLLCKLYAKEHLPFKK